MAAATGSAESAGEKTSARARTQPARRFRPARPAAASTEPVDAPKPAVETEVIVPWRPKRRRQETDFFQPTEVLRDMHLSVLKGDLGLAVEVCNGKRRPKSVRRHTDAYRIKEHAITP